MKIRMYKNEVLKLAENTYDNMDYWQLVDAYSLEHPEEPMEPENLINFIADSFIKLNNIEIMED